MILGGYFDIPSLRKKLDELSKESSKEDFWQDVNKANEITKEISNKNKIISEYESLNNEIDFLFEMSSDDSFSTLEDSILDITNRVEKMEINIYLNGDYDQLNVYLEIHPGAGGTESCDWANMLFRMYNRFCELNNWQMEIYNVSKGEEAGIKSVLAKISGDYAYGYLKNESGVHRLVRISPFDSNKRRHTSFASVTVIPVFNNNIDIVIKEDDLKIDVYHSSGAGGQSVNTSNSAVRITHLPSKIVVTCQNERSQLKNKEKALEILKARLYQMELEKQNNMVSNLKETSNIEFGNQIRSYFLEPYKLVKDHRSNYENPDPIKILDGDILKMLEFNLKNIK